MEYPEPRHPVSDPIDNIRKIRFGHVRSFLLCGRKATAPENGDKFSTAHPKSQQGFATLGSWRMCFRAHPFTARSSLRPFSGYSLARALTSSGLVAAHAQRMPRADSGRPVQHILPTPAPLILKCASALEDRMPRLIRRHVLFIIKAKTQTVKTGA
jgi:hypothetical protein